MSRKNKILFFRMIITITCVLLIVPLICSFFNVRTEIQYLIALPLAIIIYIPFIILFERQCKKGKAGI